MIAQDVITLAKDVIEYFEVKSALSGLSLEERYLYKSAIELLEKFVVEGATTNVMNSDFDKQTKN